MGFGAISIFIMSGGAIVRLNYRRQANWVSSPRHLLQSHVFSVGCIFQITAKSESDDCAFPVGASPTTDRQWKRSALVRATGVAWENTASCDATWPSPTA